MKTPQMTQEERSEFFNIFYDVLNHLPERSREIVAKRFGVVEEEPMTLQAIGDDYNITRERVRQIVQSGLRSVQEANVHEDYIRVQKIIIDFVDKNYGIVLEDHLVNSLGGADHGEHGAIRFFVEGMPELSTVNPRKYPVRDRVVVLRNFDVDYWHEVHDATREILYSEKEVNTTRSLHEKIIQKHRDLDHDKFVRYITASREIGSNPFDKWGLVEWDDISPRGVREKALLIMKERNMPMHFREIAAAIDEYGLGKKGRTSHPQTVHNELIRDKNFVLVGRGVYTINTENYVGGTVKDVIENILKNSDKPLTSEEVIDRVLEMRAVKPSTVKVNLNAVAKKRDKKYTLDTLAS